MAERSISLESILQRRVEGPEADPRGRSGRPVPLVLITYAATEGNIRDALDAIGALRDALEAALLERMVPEERFQVDVLLGDTTWETCYGLPGEGSPPRVRADITLDWPTWSQSAFRSWLRREEPDDDPDGEGLRRPLPPGFGIFLSARMKERARKSLQRGRTIQTLDKRGEES